MSVQSRAVNRVGALMNVKLISAMGVAALMAVPTTAAASLPTCFAMGVSGLTEACTAGHRVVGGLSWGTAAWNDTSTPTDLVDPVTNNGADGFATRIWYNKDLSTGNNGATIVRGSANSRDNGENALGNNPGFFELGYGGQARVAFSREPLTWPVRVLEVTTGSRNSWPEATNIFLGSNRDGSDAVFLAQLVNEVEDQVVPDGDFAPITLSFEQQQFQDALDENGFLTGDGLFEFNYVFFEDVTDAKFPGRNSTDDPTGGFDIHAVQANFTANSVSVVPEISAAHGAAALAALASLLMLTWERRRRPA